MRLADETPSAKENLTRAADNDPGIISDHLTEIFLTINHATLAGIISTLGIVTNIVNIAVFLKQGFRDTVNVSLFALALSDLSSLITLQWVNLLRNPLFVNSGVPVLPSEVQHLSGGWPHGFFSRFTSGITAYITFERCLCVLVPLKVKAIVTPNLAIVVIVTIFVILSLALIPDYATAYIDWKFDPTYNKSMLGLLFIGNREEMSILSFTMAAYVQIIFFVAVLTFTLILVIRIRQISKWRASTASVGNTSSKGTQSRDNKTVKMVVLIATIFCVCFTPYIANFITTSALPDFQVVGRYHNMFVVSWSFAFLVDSINSSVNLFVYYRMSTKYRQAFHSLFQQCHMISADSSKQVSSRKSLTGHNNVSATRSVQN